MQEEAVPSIMTVTDWYSCAMELAKSLALAVFLAWKKRSVPCLLASVAGGGSEANQSAQLELS